MSSNLEKLVLVGGGGHAQSCIEVIENTNQFSIEGIIDKNFTGDTIKEYKYLGDDTIIPKLVSSDYLFMICVGQIKTADVRVKIYNNIMQSGGKLATIKAATSYISSKSKIEEGTIIMHRAFVNAYACIGVNNIINTGSIIEHGVSIGDHNHISTGVVINGDCTIGNNNFIGSNSTLAHGITIGDHVIIGSGSNVVKSINEPGVYVGNPLKKLNK